VPSALILGNPGYEPECGDAFSAEALTRPPRPGSTGNKFICTRLWEILTWSTSWRSEKTSSQMLQELGFKFQFSQKNSLFRVL